MPHFIPEVYSKEFLYTLLSTLVYGCLTNQNFYPEVKSHGDTVHIFNPDEVTLSDYTPETAIPNPEFPNGASESFMINQSKVFNFIMDKLKKKQNLNADEMIEAYKRSAIYKARKAVDTFVGSMYATVHADNIITPTAAVTASTIKSHFIRANRILNDRDVPDFGRAAVIDPWIKELIDDYLSDRPTQLGDDITLNGKKVVNGYVGKFQGFEVYMTTACPVVEEDIDSDSTDEIVTKVLFGTKDGITIAPQIPPDTIEQYVHSNYIGDAYRGVCLFGGKMIDSGKRNVLLNAWREA